MEPELASLYDPIHQFFRNRVNNALDAEDLTQEVFLKLARPNPHVPRSVRSWVFAVARNALIDYYRKRPTPSSLPDSLQAPVDWEADAYDEINACVRPFIHKLEEPYRSLLEHVELEGRSQKALAAERGMNYTTLRSQVQRGREKLRANIEACCSVFQGGRGAVLKVKPNNACGDC